MRLFSAEEIAGALSEALQERGRDPRTNLWNSFWDRLTEGQGIPPIPLATTPHDYKVVNASTGPTMEAVANQWAKHGWRVVGVISDTRPGYAHSYVLERPVGVSHPDD